MNQDREFEKGIERRHNLQDPVRRHHADQSGNEDRSQPHVQPPELIGREAEVAALLHHLHRTDHQLVAVVGPGGMGKTSLALHAGLLAAKEEAIFPDGVAVVLLASVSHVEDVPLAIADALGCGLQGARPIVDQLMDALHARRMLLVLDNVEHLVGPDDGAVLTTLLLRILAQAPAVRLLITSRERLRLRDEWVLELGGLSIPSTGQASQEGPADAVRLFVERAHRVAPGFALTAANDADVAHICRQLEGMPLAIELAASWVRVLSAAEIASELERALDFLALADRDMPARHGSMRTALEHSWNLLNVEERCTLARLSVFRGGFDRDAAISLTGATLRTLIALLDKSLLRAETSDGVTRYRLHELVRQYAAERLADDPADRHATEERHTHYYAALLQGSLDPRTGTPTGEARKTLARNIDNLRIAWGRAIEQRNAPILATMVRGLWILHDDHGWLHDAVTLFGQAAAALRGLEGGAALVYGHVLGLHGYFLTRVADFVRALPLVQEALAVLQVADGPHDLVGFLDYVVGMCHFHLAEPVTARKHLTKAAAVAAANGDYFLDFWCEIWLGVVALYVGDYATAEGHMGKYLATFRGQGYSRGEATALAALAEVLRHQGRYSEAIAYLQQGLQIARDACDNLIAALCLCNLGALALARGELEEAGTLLYESAALTRALGDPWHTARSLAHLAQAEIAAGNAAAAHTTCAELAHYALGDEVVVLGEALYSYALLCHHTGDHAEAWALLGALDNVSVSAAIAQAAGSLRAALAAYLDADQRTTILQRTKHSELRSWLNSLAQRNPATTPAAAVLAESGKIDGLYVAETGETLSQREVEVLRLLAAGASNAAIAAQLIISLHTVKTHVAHILAKLNVATRTQAALWAQTHEIK